MWCPGLGASRSGEMEGSASPTWAPSGLFSSHTALALRAVISLLHRGPPARAAASGGGDIIHPGDKAADERWASQPLFLLGMAGPDVRITQGCGGRGSHFEIKNNSFALQ